MLRRLGFVCVLLIGITGLACSDGGTESASTGFGSDSTSLRIQPKPGQGVLALEPEGPGELGDADYNQKKTCTFKIHNTGPRPLTLEVVEKSCGCAGVELQPALVPARGTCDVLVTWVPKIDQIEKPDDTEVQLSATIQARDGNPEKDKLVIKARGRIKPALYVYLPRGWLDFGNLSVADLKGHKELAVEVFTRDEKHKGFRLQPISSSPGLRIVPADPPRLTPDRLSTHKAVDGYRIMIQSGGGLPVGRFRQPILLKTSAYPDRDLEVIVEGKVESGAVSVYPEAVELPSKIALDKGYRCPPVEVKVRDDKARTLTLEKKEPSFLQVAVEPVKGKHNVWQVKVQVPAGDALQKLVTPEQLAEYISYRFEAGAVTLRTDDPAVPVLRIPVAGSQFQK